MNLPGTHPAYTVAAHLHTSERIPPVSLHFTESGAPGEPSSQPWPDPVLKAIGALTAGSVSSCLTAGLLGSGALSSFAGVVTVAACGLAVSALVGACALATRFAERC